MAGHWTRIAVTGLVLATPALAAHHEPPPTVSTDPATHAILVAGPHHAYKPALTLIHTDWWLTGTIGTDAARDPVLMFTVDMPGWAILDHATTPTGGTLAVVVLDRRTSPIARSLGQERVAITLPRALADRGRVADLTLSIVGKTRSFPLTVPREEMAAFLDGYDAAAGGTQTPVAAPPTPVTTAPATTPAPEPAPTAPRPAALLPAEPRPQPTPPETQSTTPSPAPPPADDATPPPGGHFVSAPPDSADATPTIASLGIQIAATSSGAMVLAVTPGSKAATLGIAGGDFIEGVDGKSIKGLSTDAMVARIGAPGVKTLDCIAAGTVKLR